MLTTRTLRRRSSPTGVCSRAVEEERLNRVKYAAGLPARAIQYCLDQAGVKLAEVDHIAIPRDPRARLATKLRFAMRMPRFAFERARVMARFAGIREDLASAFDIAPESIRAKFHRIEHHPAHLASAYFVSPFERAAVLSADGLGDFASSMWAVGEGPRMRILGEITFPHSLGMYYTALTQYLGFWKFGDEYKVMGLAAYGQPEFLDEFRRIVRADGPLSFRLGLEYFTHQNQGAEMTWRDANQTPVLGRLFSPYLEQAAWPDAQSRGTARAAPSQSRGEHAGCARRGAGGAWAALAKKTGRSRFASRAAWRSIAWPTARFSITRRSSTFTCSRRLATPAYRSALRLLWNTRYSAVRANL